MEKLIFIIPKTTTLYIRYNFSKINLKFKQTLTIQVLIAIKKFIIRKCVFYKKKSQQKKFNKNGKSLFTLARLFKVTLLNILANKLREQLVN